MGCGKVGNGVLLALVLEVATASLLNTAVSCDISARASTLIDIRGCALSLRNELLSIL